MATQNTVGANSILPHWNVKCRYGNQISAKRKDHQGACEQYLEQLTSVDRTLAAVYAWREGIVRKE